jgi:ribosomal protein L16 Arg81 hydroxylase
MHDGAHDFATMIAPFDTEAFFRDYWERAPLVILRDDPTYYSRLLSMQDVDYLITSTDLRHPALRVVRNGSRVPHGEFTYNIPWSSDVFAGVLDADKVLQEYHGGATLVFEALHRTWKPLAAFCRAVEATLTHPVQTNIYLTPRNAQGFKAHWDTHDTFLMQAHGTKHWRVYDAPIPLPHRSQLFSAEKYPLGEPLLELDLRAGDFLYMPRGFVHEGLTSTSESLHITLGVIAYTWVDVFTEAVARCYQDPAFRTSLPVGFIDRPDLDGELSERFAELLQALSAGTDVQAVVEHLAERFVSTRPPLLAGQMEALRQLDTLSPETTVQRRDGIIGRVRTDDSSVVLSFHRKKVAFPRRVERAVRYVFDTPQFLVGSIPGLDDAGQLVLVRRLVEEGFLWPVLPS